MGEARLLWEVGTSGAEVRELRQRLGLDSGYTTRLLGSLEHQGLVVRAPDPRDGRVRWVRLTVAGERERAELDRRSDAFAASLLAPLTDEQRADLLAAMGTVERMVIRAQLTIAEEPAESGDVRWCFTRYFAELDERFEGGFDLSRSLRANPIDLAPPAAVVLVARLRGAPAGCGVLKRLDGGIAELKRVWVVPHARGHGIGARLIAELERRAAAEEMTLVRLETNRALPEAISMYRRAGYVEVPAFNDEPFAHHWFQKQITAARYRSATDIAARRTRKRPEEPE